MEKEYIGIIDMSFEGLSALQVISQELKNENLLYVNDPKHCPYEGRGSEEIVELVSRSYEKIKSYNLKMLVVISDTICEYAIDYLENLDLPVVNIMDCIVKSINKKYSQKNILLLSKKSVLEANIIRKDITYNRLYTVEADKLVEIVENRKVKTGESFSAVNSLFKNVSSKEVDLIVSSSPCLGLLKTEFKEYLKSGEVLDIASLISSEIIKRLKENLSTSKKGSISIILPYTEKEDIKLFKEKCNKFINKAIYIR